ncbi:MAG: hypothetical protein HY841_08840 [Bacteroidetes bacterium]|nr:hypothetical protein [Bacteroidota bacterium]
MKALIPLTTHASSHALKEELEKHIQQGDLGLKELTRKYGKQFGARNLPAPGDKLLPFTEEIKHGYEALHAECQQKAQPATHYPQAKIESDWATGKDKYYDAEIQKRAELNGRDEMELEGYDPGSIAIRIRMAIISTLIIFIGEVVFNTKAFQVAGESMLFAFVISISVSFAVFVLAHIAPLLYKSAKNKRQRVAVVAGSLVAVTALFSVLAVFRSKLLENHDVSVSPVYFVIINLFFFLVSALLSFYIFPAWEEIKINKEKLLKHRDIEKRKKEIEVFKNMKEELKDAMVHKVKHHLDVPFLTEYSAELIKKKYKETIGLFKGTNLSYRTDGQVPQSFHDEIPELVLSNVDATSTINKNKGQ